VLYVKDVIEDDDDEESDDVDKAKHDVKAIKNTNKLEERDAALRGAQQSSNSDNFGADLRITSNTVDVKNNVEKG